MVTGSADKSIKLWKAGVNTHTLTGHTDAVRAVSVLSGEEFLSAGNDATVRHWSRAGDCLGTTADSILLNVKIRNDKRQKH